MPDKLSANVELLTDVEIIVITASKDHKHALEAQQRGAHNYLFKGEDIKEELKSKNKSEV